jgi:hypothetical protein
VPGVTTALAATVALALNGLPQPEHAWFNRQKALRILAVPACAAAALVYFLVEFVPVTSSATGGREALFREEALPKAPEGKEKAGDQKRRLVNTANDLQKKVIPHFEKARQADPEDARTFISLARVYGELWSFRESLLPSVENDKYGERAVRYALEAKRLDPDGRNGYEAEYDLRLRFARQLEPDAKGLLVGGFYVVHKNDRRAIRRESSPRPDQFTARDEFVWAGEALAKYLPHDPNNARLRYQVAEAFYRAHEEERGRGQAEEALRLDALATRPQRKLTEEQRVQLHARLGDE